MQVIAGKLPLSVIEGIGLAHGSSFRYESRDTEVYERLLILDTVEIHG